jgi:hypothetical protein
MEPILLGVTDRSILVFIPDPASNDGSGLTGLAHSAITVSYTRVETDNDVVVTDVTSSLSALTNLTDAHADWGWKEVSNTLAPGLYRLDVADAVFAAGAWYAVVYVMVTASAAAATPKAFRLRAINDLDAVRMGLTALPNAAAEASGGLPTLSAAQSSSGTIPTNVLAISGDATAADNLESYLDGSEFMPVDAHAQEFSVSGGSLTTKKPDGTTDTAYSPKTVTSDAAAEPITGVS